MPKKEVKNKIASKKWLKYKIDGKTITRGKMCPKCSTDSFLADHKDRLYCGKCHYVEYKSKK
tara:strand:- start:2165 stop:2350 length:186 start_codon:yes stop_codon:yes gene_type:complete